MLRTPWHDNSGQKLIACLEYDLPFCVSKRINTIDRLLSRPSVFLTELYKHKLSSATLTLS